MRGIDTTSAVLPARKSDTTLPNAERLITALRQIGYSLEQAIADLIDNAINAGAGTVLVRFLHDGDQITSVAIVDDGSGMSESDLKDAMRFGSRESSASDTLGKFGMGLKLASLSHAQSLSVFSRCDGHAAARRWTTDGITQGWHCDRLKNRTAADMLDRSWGPMDLSQQGTLVLWSDLDKLQSHRRGLKYTLTSIDTRLRLHLGLCFHRFLESGELRIVIDQLADERLGQGMHSDITALDPFGYPESGHEAYPKPLSADLRDIGPIEMEGHIWPAKSDVPEFRLGRRSAARQGFYFYRNGRLIQAGGWNGLLHDETEPHSSLARIKVNLPVKFDADFGINVQKSSVLVPPGFPEVLTAQAPDGSTFEDYRREAIQTYRSVNGGRARHSTHPGSGLSSYALKQLRDHYAGASDEQGFGIRWSRLKADEFFRLDYENQRLLLNRNYRHANSDATIKLLLALTVRKDIGSIPKPIRLKELALINHLLIASQEE